MAIQPAHQPNRSLVVAILTHSNFYSNQKKERISQIAVDAKPGSFKIVPPEGMGAGTAALSGKFRVVIRKITRNNESKLSAVDFSVADNKIRYSVPRWFGFSESLEFNDLESFLASVRGRATLPPFERMEEKLTFDSFFYPEICPDMAEKKLENAKAIFPYSEPFVFRHPSFFSEPPYGLEPCASEAFEALPGRSQGIMFSYWDPENKKVKHLLIDYDLVEECFWFNNNAFNDIPKLLEYLALLFNIPFKSVYALPNLESKKEAIPELVDDVPAPPSEGRIESEMSSTAGLYSSESRSIHFLKWALSELKIFTDARPFSLTPSQAPHPLYPDSKAILFCYYDQNGRCISRTLPIVNGNCVDIYGGSEITYPSFLNLIKAYGLNEVDVMSSLRKSHQNLSELTQGESTDFYSSYHFDFKQRKNLTNIWEHVSTFKDKQELTISGGRFGEYGDTVRREPRQFWMPSRPSPWIPLTAQQKAQQQVQPWTAPCTRLVFNDTVFKRPSGLVSAFDRFPKLETLVLQDVEFWVENPVKEEQDFKAYLKAISEEIAQSALKTIIIKPKSRHIIEDATTEIEDFRRKHPDITLKIIL